MPLDPPQGDSLLERGIAALRVGERARARALLVAAVRADPRSAQAWIWLAGALDDRSQQRECLERALALDPESAAARRGLEALRAGDRKPGTGSQEPRTENREPRTENREPRTENRQQFRHAPLTTLLLGALGGIGAALAWAAWHRLGNEAEPGAILALVLLAGPPLGWVALILAGVLLRISGRWLGGRGGAGAVRAGLAWAAAPQAVGLLIWAGQLALIPTASFGGGAAPPEHVLPVTICWGVHGLLALGSAYLAVAGVAAAHQIVIWRAAVAWLLAALLVLGTLAGIFASAALLIALRGG